MPLLFVRKKQPLGLLVSFMNPFELKANPGPSAGAASRQSALDRGCPPLGHQFAPSSPRTSRLAFTAVGERVGALVGGLVPPGMDGAGVGAMAEQIGNNPWPTALGLPVGCALNLAPLSDVR